MKCPGCACCPKYWGEERVEEDGRLMAAATESVTGSGRTLSLCCCALRRLHRPH